MTIRKEIWHVLEDIAWNNSWGYVTLKINSMGYFNNHYLGYPVSILVFES